MEEKLRQLNSLFLLAKALNLKIPDEDDEEIQQVRERWVRLKEIHERNTGSR